MIVSSAIMASIAYIDSFLLLAIMRVFLGFISSAFNPFSFSILADYFPKE
jgi:MFS family permease